MSRKRHIDSDTSSETDSAPRLKRAKGVLSGTDSGGVSPRRTLASHFTLPQLLAQLRVFTVGTQEACTSFDHPVSPPSLCWSYRLCTDVHSPPNLPLTSAPVFMHAFDILCNAILASSVDIVVAVLPQVQDVQSFMSARPGIENLLESFLRGERPLKWECATPSQLLEFPAGAPLALHGGHASAPLSLTYSPLFSRACHAFAWGSVGYLHMLLHVMRLLCYLIIGHIIPAWHSGRCPWNHDDASITHKRLSHVPLQPLAQGNRAPGRVPPEATAPLHIGIDPGLWALAQLFRTSWVQVCTEPVTVAGSQHAQRGCLFCSRHSHGPPAERAAGREPTLECPHTTAMHEPAMAETVSCRLIGNATASSRQASVAGNACVTCTAAPLIVMQPSPGSCELGLNGNVGHAPAAAAFVLRGDNGAAVMYPSAGRFGTRMHDNAPQEYVAQLVALLGDHLVPRADQIRQLGSLQSFPEPGDSGRGGGSARGAAGMHVDLMQGTWGTAVQRAVVEEEVAGRQGRQAMAPGLLGGQRACFAVPALGAPEALLRSAAGSLAQCQEARLFTGCHQ